VFGVLTSIPRICSAIPNSQRSMWLPSNEIFRLS